jgi:gliding motility-associated-like protein
MRKILLFVIFFAGFFLQIFATHQRAGEITYKAISELKYEFTIVTYTYTPSPADRPELTIRWGDGTSGVIPRTQKINLPNNISRNVYAGANHIYPGQGTYTVSVEDPNRNYGVLNIPNSVNVPFFIQTQLVINPFLGPNNSVELLSPPIDVGCVNNLYLHNPGAFDVDGDSISYKLVTCRGAYGLPIPGFVLPNLVDPMVESSFSIDSLSGTIVWDKPVLQGEYNIAFLVEEWRNGAKIGYVTRDMQITIIACDNNPPVINQLNDTCVLAGTTLTFAVSASDPDEDELRLFAVGGPLIVEDSPATFPTATGVGNVNAVFTWSTVCSHVQMQPYQMVFYAKDTLNTPQLSDIKTMNIRVISPAPENLSAFSVGNSIHLSWQKAICQKAIGYEVFRRNGFYGFVPGYCETGVPDYTGYLKIAAIEGINDTTFIDNEGGNGLIHGIDYCYMVVAYFADGGRSYASDEVCTSLKKDIPILTNVSVQKTSSDNGEIFVGWSKPTEMDTLLYPPPYKYLIWKAAADNPADFVRIDSTNSINDTLFFDAGINTATMAYLYKIDLFSLPGNDRYYVGSTQKAKSIFVQVQPSDNSLILSWNVEVPWKNEYYAIYRLNAETNLFDSVGVSVETYFTDTGLENGKSYAYFVKSSGKYTATGLVDPIINFSQIAAGIPVDNVPPCPPDLNVETECDRSENILNWTTPVNCPADISKYLIYYSSGELEEPVLIDSVVDSGQNQYIHSNLSSIAGCYFIIAVDSLGNQSEQSNKICINIDACPAYRLPNVFTPNEDDINDRFRPFPYTSVDHIDLRIFNRWGRIVFETDDPDINWDGKNMNNNIPCSAGAYFYVCDVFEIRLNGLMKRTITGSVTIFR